MSTFVESGLRFGFPDEWAVRKYDDHTFYQGLSGAGLKAVDFIILPDDGSLWLIEVKNFRLRSTPAGLFQPKIKSAEQLAESLSRKMTDTLRAIRVVHQYYRRNWLFRWLEPWLLRLDRYDWDWVFWAKAAHRSQQVQQRHLLLWLELPEGRKKYRTRVYSAVQAVFQEEDITLHTGGQEYNPLPGMVTELI